MTDTTNPVPIPHDEIDLRPWGYAPGGYLFKCQDCPADLPILERAVADKYSWRCEKHALEAMQREPTPAAQVASGEMEAPNDNLFDGAEFSKRIIAKLAADRMSYRDAAPLVRCCHATLNRASRGLAPDVENYLRISRWLTETPAKPRDPVGEDMDDIVIAALDDVQRMLMTKGIMGRTLAISRLRNHFEEFRLTSLAKAEAGHNALVERVAELEEALRFYADTDNQMTPDEGPWGANSTDFGSKARFTLAILGLR